MATVLIKNNSACYVDFVPGKIGKRIAMLGKEVRRSRVPVPRRYLAGLSFGPSSTILAGVLDDSAKYHAGNKSSSPFTPLVVHVDLDLTSYRHSAESPAQRRLALYRERYPNISFECVHLSRAVALKTIDWAALPVRLGEEGDDAERLRVFFDALPSVTSRADVLRLLVRHVLMDVALEQSYSVLLLGHTTTALAAMTLAEVANGRGFAVPWQVNDGPYTICSYEQTLGTSGEHDGESRSREISRAELPVYYPVRDIFRNEILTFLELTPSVGHLVPEDTTASNAVVSHKDQSIEEVMQRYFSSVEGPYSGIVANVVRTSGKLSRADGGDDFCHMCGSTLDEQGDSRWAGELGDEGSDAPLAGRCTKDLCYGCKRSLGG